MLVLLLLWETVLRTSSSRESKVSQSLFRTPDHCWATYPRGCGIWEVGGSSLRARKQHSYWHKILPGKSAVETTNANLWAYPRRESDFLAYVSSPSFPTNQSHIKKSSVVSGDHTRSIQIATPTVGGLMKFAVKTVTCLGCKTALRSNNSVQSVSLLLPWNIRLSWRVSDGAVCNNCRPKISELYQKQVTMTSELQVRFARLWTQCQRCQGSLHQVRITVSLRHLVSEEKLKDVLCTSKDCPIYYMRKKAQKDVEDANGVLERFDEEMWWHWRVYDLASYI